ncbi:MAG: HIT domain-containing protein [Syntrophales bacterium]|nr:HIT domain-containing protein [Syntrophales bacterium]
MDAISAPWRMAYIKGEKPKTCVLCDKDCNEGFVLLRGEHALIMLNLYPYTAGHVMVVPARHVAGLEDLNADERRELFDFCILSVQALKKALNPHGFNIGMNLGEAAGAGVEDHLHIHIVPRWRGDTNFMTVVGEVRVIPEDIKATWEKLLPFFAENVK